MYPGMKLTYNSGIEVFEKVSWAPPVVVTVSYLSTVAVVPIFMKDLKAWEVKEAMIAYNLFQVRLYIKENMLILTLAALVSRCKLLRALQLT